MNLPKTYHSFMKLLIQIAENGSDYTGIPKEDHLEIGFVIGEIQNWLGEHEELLNKLKLKYNA